MPPDGTVNIAQSPEDLRCQAQRPGSSSSPTFVLLVKGLWCRAPASTSRVDHKWRPMPASDKMWVALASKPRAA